MNHLKLARLSQRILVVSMPVALRCHGRHVRWGAGWLLNGRIGDECRSLRRRYWGGERGGLGRGVGSLRKRRVRIV
jgi:hypothetical protein